MTGDLSRNLRVTFVRLDEVLTGNLVREQTPEIEQLFGGAKLIDNEVSAELRALFHDFAHKTVMPATNIKFTVKVKALRADEMSHAVSVELPSITANENEVRRFWSISSKTVNVPQPNEYGIQYPKLSEGFFSKTNTRWPDGFKQFYVCQNDAILCTELWRYISRLSELDVIEHDMDEKRVAPEDAGTRDGDTDETVPEAAGTRDKSDWDEDIAYIYKTHFSLFRYLGKTGWPEKFLVMQAKQPECGYGLETSYIMPPLAFDVAIIENSSSEPIRILDLLGVMETNGGLRLSTSASGSAGPAAPLGRSEILLPPLGKIIVPLHIAFLVEDWSYSMPFAMKMYRRIMSKPSNAIFSVTGRIGDGRNAKIDFKVRRTRESFQRPETPAAAEYRFGPQLILSGLLLGTGDIQFDQREANSVTLNEKEDSESEQAQQPDAPDVELHLHQNVDVGVSCPILYYWDDARREWVNRGKVIDGANGETHETTVTVEVGSDNRRFRLAEEELEVTSLRRLQLILTLRDGRRSVIDPVERNRFRSPASPFRIRAYSAAHFNFSVPEEYTRIGIERAELAITGYYTRYNEILASELLRTNRRKY
jgi:hypothetical protein